MLFVRGYDTMRMLSVIITLLFPQNSVATYRVFGFTESGQTSSAIRDVFEIFLRASGLLSDLATMLLRSIHREPFRVADYR